MCVLCIHNTKECIIKRRVNRFVVEVDMDGKAEFVHNTNTGRLEEFLVNGKKALCKPLKRQKKLAWRLFAVEHKKGWAIVDTSLQEEAFKKIINLKLVDGLKDCTVKKRAPKVGGSTFDFLLECKGKEVFVEIKSAVLESEEGFGMYPDCPSDRGLRHIQKLVELSKESIQTLLLFIVAFPGAKGFKPYTAGDPRIAKVLHDSQRVLNTKAIGIEFLYKERCVNFYGDLPVIL